MAHRAQPVSAGALAAGGGALALVVVLCLGTILAVALRAEPGGGLRPADIAAVRFTLLQAAMSASISVALAIPLARALARRTFPGRSLLITLIGAPFVLPVVVAVMGLVTVFGRSGWVNAALGWAGLPAIEIYGLTGVVLAHVFFNLPLATRLILQGWLAIPAEQFRLAASLGFSARDVARHLERPMLLSVLPGAAIVIFLVCLTSFAVALTLGGGPRATTVELAIYQAFRFDFDLSRAATLGLVQLAVTAAAAALAVALRFPIGVRGGLDRTVARWDAKGIGYRATDAAIIALAALFLVTPLAAIVARGAAGLATLPQGVWGAAARSVAVALGSTALSVAAAFALALLATRLARRPLAGRVVEAAGYLPVAASPIVIGTGLFILINPVLDPATLVLPVTAAVNAVIALPFALRVLIPAMAEVEARFGPLADTLGLTGATRLRIVLLPRLRRPLGFAAGLSAAFSMGDLGVVALFADPDRGTLPLRIYQLMGAYRMDAASAAALLLLGLTLGLFWIFDRGGRVNADA